MFDPFTFVLLLVLFVFVLPIWIFFNYLGKIRSNKTFTSEDEKMLEELWQMAKKMEDRMETLETILNHDAPGRRK